LQIKSIYHHHQYFKSLRTTKSHSGTSTFAGTYLSIHHIWGRTLVKHNQDACAEAYADDGYIKAKLSVAFEVLSDISLVLKEDAGLDLNDKTKILVKGISVAEAHAAAQLLLAADPSLAQIGPLLSSKAFVVDCYIGLGVPIGTDALVQHFVNVP
jgi:hypothetical protein